MREFAGRAAAAVARAAGRRYVRLLGYVLFFAVCFLLFLRWKLPMEEVARSVETQIALHTPYRASVEGARLRGLYGLEIVRLRLTAPAAAGPPLVIERLRMDPPLGMLLGGGGGRLPFEASLDGGGVRGVMTVAAGVGVSALRVEVEAVDLKAVSPLVAALFPDRRRAPHLEGRVSGRIGIERSRGGQEGEMALTGEGITVDGLYLYGQKLPPLSGLTGRLDAKLGRGRMKIERLVLEGERIHLTLRGQLPPPWSASPGGRLSLTLALKTDEPAFALLKSFLKPGPDGAMRARITGTLARPRLVVERSHRRPRVPRHLKGAE